MKKTIKYLGVEEVRYTLFENDIKCACIDFVKSELPGDNWSYKSSDNWSYKSSYNYDINGDGILVIELVQRQEVEQVKPEPQAAQIKEAIK